MPTFEAPVVEATVTMLLPEVVDTLESATGGSTPVRVLSTRPLERDVLILGMIGIG